MEWAYGITCAPREIDTLTPTVESLQMAGFHDPYLFAEPDTPIPDDLCGSRLFCSDVVLGPWPNLIRSIRGLLDLKPNAEAIAVFQDDIKLAEGAEDARDRNLWPAPIETLGVVSLYLAWAIRMTFARSHKGWFELDPKVVPSKAYGALAYVFPRKAAQRLAANPPNILQSRPSDSLTARWCKGAGLGYWHYSPSLVEHTGSKSTVNRHHSMGATRTAKEWVQNISAISV